MIPESRAARVNFIAALHEKLASIASEAGARYSKDTWDAGHFESMDGTRKSATLSLSDMRFKDTAMREVLLALKTVVPEEEKKP